ncbi:MAG TPA: succinate dehydrogenase, cytochrome b556 subunit [Gammaproteobacteria bacterium]|nr:succinate dehydrogenase, cytochrome b556 subunit [Gammaproteobacteria bacterium]
MQDDPRPLSPHLQIYRPQLTSVLSISHRATGVFLALGTLALVYWFAALASGPEVFAQAQMIAGAWYGQVLLVLWTFSLFYHLCNGIRHLFWDAGYGFEIRQAYASGYVVLVAAAVLTAGTWVLALAGGQ